MIYETHYHQKVLDFAGLHRISGHQTLIQVSGMPLKCLGCKNYGHIRKNCPKCSKCNGHGHESDECSLINRIKSNENNANTDEFVFDDDSMDEDEKEEKATVTEAPVVEANVSVVILASAANFTAAPAANAAPLPVVVDEPEVVEVVNSSVTNSQMFTLITSDSKIFKKPNTVEVKKELLDAATKVVSQYQKRKARIIQIAIGKFVEQESSKRKIAKEEAMAEFAAMNEQAKKEVLRPFRAIKKSKSKKNNGSELSSSSKVAAIGETDYDMLESDC